jgi:hypothetical protein
VRNIGYDPHMSAKFGILLLLAGISAAQTSAARRDWELVRSVPNGYGGTLDLVLIPEAKQRDRDNYMHAADAICGSRITCMVNFWTDRTHIPEPKSGWIPVGDLAVMTASYERSPTYKEPVLHLACWLYPSKTVGESEKCSYLPGAKKPPDK